MNNNTFFKSIILSSVLFFVGSNFGIIINANPIISISNADELFGITNCLFCDYELVNDIDLSLETDSQYYDEVKGWPSIGSLNNEFKGSFNGNGHFIKNLRINSNTNRVGLFGNTHKATINNLVLLDVEINGNEYVGGLVGYAYEGTNINQVSIHGEVSGKNYVGGLAGNLANAHVNEVYTNGSVSGQISVGGVVGRAASSSTANNMFSEMHVEGQLCGDTYSSNCQVGGLVGSVLSSAGSISNGYFKGLLVNGRESTFLQTSNKYVNPLVGYQQHNKLYNLYHSVEHPIFIDKFIGGSETNNKASYDGFDFDDIWDIDKYAFLKSGYYIKEPQIISIEVSQKPHQLEFDEDEAVDLEGLEVIAIYDNDDTQMLTINDYETHIDIDNQRVLVTYKEFETSFEITINPINYYSINLTTKGYGGNTTLRSGDEVLGLSKTYRQGTIIDITHELDYFGRLKEVLVNGESFNETSIVLNQDLIIEINYMLLGDHNNDGVLNEIDLEYYLSIIKNKNYQDISDVNENGRADIADFVYLRRHMILNHHINSSKASDEVFDMKINLLSIENKSNLKQIKIAIKPSQIGAIYFSLANTLYLVEAADKKSNLLVDYSTNSFIVYPKDSQLGLDEEVELILSISESDSFLVFDGIQYSNISGNKTEEYKDITLDIKQPEESLIPDNYDNDTDVDKPTTDNNSGEINIDSINPKINEEETDTKDLLPQLNNRVFSIQAILLIILGVITIFSSFMIDKQD